MTPSVLEAMGGARESRRPLPVSPYPRTPDERAARARVVIRRADATGDLGDAAVVAHRALRRAAFVREQGLFAGHDLDAHDEDPRTIVLVAVDTAQAGGLDGGAVLGGVRIHPADAHGRDVGWWRGSRLVARRGPGLRSGLVGAHLVEAACRAALAAGALRFDATVQDHCAGFFARLGWEHLADVELAGRPHAEVRWPIDRVRDLVAATKLPLGGLLDGVNADAAAALGGAFAAWTGDDGIPVPGSDVVACVDAILPSMVDADPEWAGWCGMLVTAHDLSAMGARPVGVLDALAAPDEAHAAAVLAGIRAASERLRLPVLGGHTTLGPDAALSVTGLGRTARPVPGGGGRAGDELRLTADLAGGWRPGHAGRQWDSSTHRTRDELAAMLDAVPLAGPAAAKDVSMAGILGTVGMLAEASGCGAEVDVAALPRPAAATPGDWLTCFPGFAMVTADRPGAPAPPAGPAVSALCGRLSTEPGVRLRWPDGTVTTVLEGPATGLGPATAAPSAAPHDLRTGTTTSDPREHR